MRLLFWTLLAFLWVVDVFAALCAVTVSALFGVAWVAGLPFEGLGRILVALSRRISSGRAR